MRPVWWSISYLLRCPLGISMVTSNSTARGLPGLGRKRAHLVSPTAGEARAEGGERLRTSRGLPVLVAVVVTVAGVTALVLQDEPATSPAAAPSPTADPSRPALLPSLDEDAPPPTAPGLQDALRTGLADPALRGGVAVS